MAPQNFQFPISNCQFSIVDLFIVEWRTEAPHLPPAGLPEIPYSSSKEFFLPLEVYLCKERWHPAGCFAASYN
jgi:hypothetical protein